MKAALGVWLTCALAAAWPLTRDPAAEAGRPSAAAREATFPGWPETFEGKPWIRVAQSERVAKFAAGLGGETGVFVQNGRVVVLRWVSSASRAVHPIADCFRAHGYALKRGVLIKDPAGEVWTEFEAERDGERWRVRERIADEQGGSWSDVSAWYWAAQRGTTPGPWWAITIAEPDA